MAQIAFLIPFLVAIPMALLFGFSLSSPDNYFNILIMALCFGVMLLPILIRWHDIFLVAAWNMPISLYFLPGHPQLWLLLVLLSSSILVVSGGISRNIDPDASNRKPPSERAVAWSLVLISGIVLLTALLRGGIGSQAFGSETYGARRYFPILFAAAGYFVLSRFRFPPARRGLIIAGFFGGYLLLGASNLIYMAGPSFYWLFYLFPADFAFSQAMVDTGAMDIARFTGIAFAMTGVVCYMLARYGIRGIFDFSHIFRLLTFVAAFGVSTLGGFRSLLVLMFLIFLVQFLIEGVHRTPLFPILIVTTTLTVTGSIVFVHKMPLSVQRTLSFLPIEVDPLARENAVNSTEWRLRMWQVLLDEVPHYLILGKGYTINPAELALFDWARMTHQGHFEDYEESMAVGNYHSGPFSVLLSFGIAGVLAVVFFWGAGIRMLHRNLTRGSPELRAINITLLSCFIARIIFFLGLFGDLSSDLPVFCGLLGLSVALNRSN